MTSRGPALIVHGGAGADPASGREELRRGIRNAVAAGWAVLSRGGGAVDAVEAAVCAMARARALGIPFCDPEELITDAQRKRLESLTGGTVGAVALDRAGLIAAATSTGGTAGKLPGRVGDSPLIGCGTYAESTSGGVSCTGDGEAIIRVVLARRTIDILKLAADPMHACPVAVDVLVEEGRGGGGLICIDWKGRLGWAHSTPLMPVGFMAPGHDAPTLTF